MIRDICRDETFLAQRAERAGLEDLETARDLLDTLAAHKESCVGMAANMMEVCLCKYMNLPKTISKQY